MSNAKFSSLVTTLKARAAMSAGAAKDLEKCFNPKSQYCFSETTLIMGEKSGVDFELLFTLPQKQIFRAIGFINALVSGIPGDFDYTHARILCAMRLAGAHDLNTDALTALAAGVISPTANTRGISSGAVNRMFSRSHKLTTVNTKVSNMTGKNGFSQVLGMTFAAPGETNHTIALNDTHPMIKRFFTVIDGATLGQIDAMTPTDK